MKVKELMKIYKREKAIDDKDQRNQIIHFAYTPFTGLGLGAGKDSRGFRGDEWFKSRIELFKNYTLKSLINQTEQCFVHWISFRPEEQSNPLTQQLFSYLCGIKWRTVFTFGGLCWRDDKFKNDKIEQRLKDTLPALKDVVGDAKYVYETVVPSDDLYAKDAFDIIQKQPYKENGALVFWGGYIYNHNTKQLAEWDPQPKHLPPFYTIMYPADVFLDPKKHLKYMKDFNSHEDIERIFDCVRLPDRKYCVSVHGNNISTNWVRDDGSKHQFIGKEIIDEAEKQKILKTFGIENI